MMVIKSTLISLTAGLLLGSGPAFAAVAGEPSPVAEASAAAAQAPVAEASPEPCAFGMCKEAQWVEPGVETVIRSDVMPTFYSPALNPTVEAEAGC